MARSSLLVAVTVLTFAGCASGSGGGDEGADPDAEVGTAPDAARSGDPDAPSGPIDATPIDATPIDAMPIDAMPIDAMVGGPPDTCAQAEDVTTDAMGGAGATRTGNTTGYADDISTPSSCTGYSADGPDAIYAVTVGAGVTITATATPTTAWDISLEIVSPCAFTPTCHAGADSGFGGDPETAAYTTTAAGTYFIAVDSYSPGTEGAYSVNIRVQ